MKKFLFLALAAMLALTSCTQDETLAVVQNGSIGFDVSSDKATRSVYDPSISTNGDKGVAITNFAVYGFMDNITGSIFNDELVSGSNATGWSYQNTQHWIKDHNYYFAALAPSNDRNWTLTREMDTTESKYGVGSVHFVNREGKQDLLYWANTTPIVGKASGNSRVPVQFGHLLSKVKFSFVNDFDNQSVNLKVSNIRIEGLEAEGNIDLATSDWATRDNAWQLDTTSKVDFNFGAASVTAENTADRISQYAEMESYNELLLFPQTQRDYLVKFTVELYYGDVHAITYNHNINVPVQFVMGKAYDLKATINAQNIVDPDDPNHEGDSITTLEPIEFEVIVTDWEQAGEVEMPGLDNVAEAALLQAINNAQAGETVTLTDNVVLSQELNLTKDLTLNLNGKTLATASNWTRSGDDTYSFPIMVSGGTLILEGDGKVVAGDGDYSMAVWVRGGNLVIKGGKFYNGGETTDLIYVQTGTVTIEGGEFIAAENKGLSAGTGNRRCALNCYDTNYKNGTANIVVKGGKFFEFDPANNVSEGVNTNFVATGYKSVYDNATGYYTVVRE